MGAGPSVLSRRATGSMRGMTMSVASSVRTHAPLIRKPKYKHAEDPWFACEAGDIDMIANKIDKVCGAPWRGVALRARWDAPWCGFAACLRSWCPAFRWASRRVCSQGELHVEDVDMCVPEAVTSGVVVQCKAVLTRDPCPIAARTGWATRSCASLVVRDTWS